MQKTSNVINIKPAEQKASEKKWGKKVIGLGFCIVPSLLLRAQGRLGLNPTQLAILLQLLDFWWDKERKPYPGKKALSERLGIGPRQIQRYMVELEKAGFLKRIERTAPGRGKITNEYDLSGLAEKLKKLEPEFNKVKETAKKQSRQIKRRGGLKDLTK